MEILTTDSDERTKTEEADVLEEHDGRRRMEEVEGGRVERARNLA